MYYNENLSSFLHGHSNSLLNVLEELPTFQEVKQTKITMYAATNTQDTCGVQNRYLHFSKGCNYYSVSWPIKEMTMQELFDKKAQVCTICSASELSENLASLLLLAKKTEAAKKYYYSNDQAMGLINNLDHILTELRKLTFLSVNTAYGWMSPLLSSLKEEAIQQIRLDIKKHIEKHDPLDVYNAFLHKYSADTATIGIISKKIAENKSTFEDDTLFDTISLECFLTHIAVPNLNMSKPLAPKPDLRSFCIDDVTLSRAKALLCDRSSSLGVSLVSSSEVSKSYLRKTCLEFYKAFVETRTSFSKKDADVGVLVKVSVSELLNDVIRYKFRLFSKEAKEASITISMLYYYCLVKEDFFSKSLVYLPLGFYNALKKNKLVSLSKSVEGIFSAKELEVIASLEKSFSTEDSLQKACDTAVFLRETHILSND